MKFIILAILIILLTGNILTKAQFDVVNEHLKNGYKLHEFLITDGNTASPAYIQVVVKWNLQSI